MDSLTEMRPRTRCWRGSLYLELIALAVALIVLMMWPLDRVTSQSPYHPGSCLDGIRDLDWYTIDHARSNKGVLPSSANWHQIMARNYRGWDRDFTQCRFPGRLGTVKHVFNPRWSNTVLSEIPNPESAILIYDAIDGKPAYRRRTYYRNLYEKLRHSLERPGLGVGYVDGRRRWVSDRLTPRMIAEGRDPFWPKREWWKR